MRMTVTTVVLHKNHTHNNRPNTLGNKPKEAAVPTAVVVVPQAKPTIGDVVVVATGGDGDGEDEDDSPPPGSAPSCAAHRRAVGRCVVRPRPRAYRRARAGGLGRGDQRLY